MRGLHRCCCDEGGALFGPEGIVASCWLHYVAAHLRVSHRLVRRWDGMKSIGWLGNWTEGCTRLELLRGRWVVELVLLFSTAIISQSDTTGTDSELSHFPTPLRQEMSSSYDRVFRWRPTHLIHRYCFFAVEFGLVGACMLEGKGKEGCLCVRDEQSHFRPRSLGLIPASSGRGKQHPLAPRSDNRRSRDDACKPISSSTAVQHDQGRS